MMYLRGAHGSVWKGPFSVGSLRKASSVTSLKIVVYVPLFTDGGILPVAGLISVF